MDLFFRMIRGAYQWSAFHLLKPFFQSFLSVECKLFGSNICCYRIMLVCGLKVLAYGQYVAVHPAEVVHQFFHFFRSLAQSHHNAGLGGSIAFCNLPQHFQACFILGGTAYEGADTTDSLHVVRNDFRLCIDDLCNDFLSSLEVGNQHFDGGVRVEPLDFPDGTYPVRRA